MKLNQFQDGSVRIQNMKLLNYLSEEILAIAGSI